MVSSCNLNWFDTQHRDLTDLNCQFLKPHVLLAALKQFEYQATNRLLLATSEEYEDSGTTQKKDVKKTPAKMLPSTLSKQCMCTITFFCK